MGPVSRSLLRVLLSLGVLTRALELDGLFPFGEEAGDQQLPPGSDSTAELRLAGPVRFFSQSFRQVYVNTNGFVAFDDPPAEDVYLGKMPASFKMVAALLGDLDTSDRWGRVHFRQDSSPGVLSRAAGHIRRAFPRDGGVEPATALVVTWENMAARGVPGRGDGLDAQRNTFQLVLASMASSSCAILLYPRGGVQFLSTPVGGQTKLLETGFNQGLVPGWWWNTKQGTYFRVTTDEEPSIRDLTEKTTSGQKGVWVYEIGASPIFTAITPGLVSDLPEQEDATESPATILPRQPDDGFFSTYDPQELLEGNAELPTETPTDSQPRYPEAEAVSPGYAEPETDEGDDVGTGQLETEYRESETVTPTYVDPETVQQTHPDPSVPKYPDQTRTSNPVFGSSQPNNTIPETNEPRKPSVELNYPEQPKTSFPVSEPLQPKNTVPETSEPKYSPIDLRFPEQTESPDLDSGSSQTKTSPPGTDEARYSPMEPDDPNPEQVPPVPPYSQPHQPQVVVVDADEDHDVNEFGGPETCAHNRHRCSALADCQDYSSGSCCRCRPGFYGDGKDCVAEGKPQRINGKVNGRVFVGSSPSPVELGNHDLHTYVVANDGRAYVAVSSIPESLGPSLLPLSSLGGAIGWAFALEQPGFQNGFSLIGGVFSQQAEVIFQPGGERLSIKQQFRGIDEHEHLVVSTELEGRVPAVLLGSSVQISPYKEIYQYDRGLITSSSDHEYTITSPDGTNRTRSYQWRQTITFQSCPHDDAIGAAPPTQQLSVDQVFVMFDANNRLIRYAMSNKIGSVHGSLPEQNPCFTGRHGCDVNAVCRPGDGLWFSCQCSSGFSGDGRYCHDIDECRETPQVCGPNAACSNQPGTFRCRCLSGFTFASDGRTCIEESHLVDPCQRGTHDCDVLDRALCSYRGGPSHTCSCLPGFTGDGRVCRDVDECQQVRCHRDASCSNTQGSYTCRCNPGFQGNGFQCSPTSSGRGQTQCERHRAGAQAFGSASGFLSFLRPQLASGQFIPQCDQRGAYEATQCHHSIQQCWCVDASGREIPSTRSSAGSAPPCIDQAVTPPPMGPAPRPDVRPATGAHLLVAQSGRIEGVPLDGVTMKTQEARTLLHVPDRVLIAVAYDCVDNMVYWSDITGPAISRARLTGGKPHPVITADLQSPEGVAVDHVSRLLFWTDSMRDTVEVSRLDGSQRRVLVHTDLVNPRPIVTNPPYGQLYWADWNRDGPKIEMSNMDGTGRTVLVKDDLGLPNGLTFDLDLQQLCWADAGTRKVECLDPHRGLRTPVLEGIQYPFALVAFGRKLFYTDWRRGAVVSVDRQSQEETDEFLPHKRSRLYGVAMTTTQCQQAYSYCSNNGGCSHLCLPRRGGFTCRCPDAASDQCVERSL